MKNLASESGPKALHEMQSERVRQLEALRALGFLPAFYDFATCTLHASRRPDGRPAATHDLDGLPDEVVVLRSEDGRVIAVKSSLTAGFERNGYFFTHATALRAARDWGSPAR